MTENLIQKFENKDRLIKKSKLEENLGVLGGVAGAIVLPWAIMNYMNADGKEIIAAYFGTLGGAIAGGYSGKFLGRAINSIRQTLNEIDLMEAECNTSHSHSDSNREDKSDDNRTFSGTGYPG